MEKKWNGLLGLSVQFLLVGAMSSCLSTAVLADQNYTLASVEAGYRVDQLDWNIGGLNTGRTDQYVNVLSELTWSDVEIQQLAFQLDTQDKNGYSLRWRMSFGTVIRGDNQDSDFDFDNRQEEFSRSNNNAGGDVSDLLIGVGKRYDIKWRNKVFSFMPVLGYSVNKQNFEMNNGFQTLFVPTPGGAPDPSQVGSISGLNSTYDTKWETFWLGLDVEFEQTEKLLWLAGMKFHGGDLTAQANWNLRSDFAHPVSFEHWADGYGVGATISGRYRVATNLFVSLTLDYQNWSTDKGIDRVHFSTGSSIDTRLNEVNWETTAVSLGLIWRQGK